MKSSNSKMALVAAALAASFGGAPAAMSQPNHLAIHRSQPSKPTAHLTKKGPGRGGLKPKRHTLKRHAALWTGLHGRGHRDGYEIRNLRKLLGTRG